MTSTLLAAIAALTTISIASPVTRSTIGIDSKYLQAFKNASVQTSIGGHAICVSGMVDVTPTSMNIDFNLPPITNQSVLTSMITNLLTVNSTFAKDAVVGKKQVSGTFGIYSELCLPLQSQGVPNTTVQFLTHGGGCKSSSYWKVAHSSSTGRQPAPQIRSIYCVGSFLDLRGLTLYR
jgi:hypothetical protein